MKLNIKMQMGILLAMTCLLCTSCAQAQKRKDWSVGLHMREAIEWCGIRHIDANKDDLPRVLLVGDSIVGAHADKVSELLKGSAYCSWLTTSRCLGDPAFEQELELILRQYKYAIIYFNNGLHGAPFSTEQYGEALGRVFKQLVNTGAITIWRATTPINPNADDDAGRQRLQQRNTIAAKYAANYNIEIDSFGIFEAKDYIDNVHYNSTAIETQAQHITKTIQKHLGTE